MFEFLVGRSSLKRTMLRLGEDMGLPQKERGLRLGEGVYIGEGMLALASPRNSFWGFLVRLGATPW